MAQDSTSEVTMALYNAPTFSGAFMTSRKSPFGRTIRPTIISVRRTLRAMEIEKDGTMKSYASMGVSTMDVSMISYINVIPSAAASWILV